MDRSIRYSIILVLIVSAINFALVAFSLFLSNLLQFSPLFHWLIMLAACIISASIIVYMIVSTSPLLRNYLQSFRHLIRLESLNHPLLIRFSHEAPGTYHHTIAVANIAVKASKAIGANPLLTRVGAYYHDIGKLAHPDNFVENQKPGLNRHDELNNPQKSAKYIINHVSDGVRIAQENHLPSEIINLIRQHQGTTLVSFFYNQAKENGLKVKKSDFRYPGPKPLSREGAILMLADSIEAAVRAHPELSIPEIKRIINDIIEQRISDQQLEFSGLTSAQLAKIRQSFLESISALFHQRIRYPNGEASHKGNLHVPNNSSKIA